MRMFALLSAPMLAIPALLALTLALPLRADGPDAAGGWKHVDEDDGITLWKHEVPGQSVPGFRGQVVIDTGFEPIVKAIEDTSKHTEWMYRCAESTLLKQVGDSEYLLYNRTDSPWPVSDRDVVLRSVKETKADGSEILMRFQNVTDASKPPVNGVVRMPKLRGYYKLTKVEGGKTQVTYEVEADVGGRLPDWIVRSVVKDMPYNTLDRLRARVKPKK